jgi:signal peptidase I
LVSEEKNSQTETRPEEEEDDIKELLKALALAAVIALTVRSFLFEPFNIPSSSMAPTLLVGDYLFVEKYAYGYSKYSFPLGIVPIENRIFEKTPARGDVAVFRQPKQLHIDYIKRIVGLPGDSLQMRGGVLYINGAAVSREFKGSEDYAGADVFGLFQRYIETLPNDKKHFIYEMSDEMRLDNTPLFTVPEGYYFVMGDNRDNSTDSRVPEQVGLVPARNLIGRALFIFFSTEGVGFKCERTGALAALKSLGCKVIEYPKAIRFNRMFKRIDVL